MSHTCQLLPLQIDIYMFSIRVFKVKNKNQLIFLRSTLKKIPSRIVLTIVRPKHILKELIIVIYFQIFQICILQHNFDECNATLK